MRKRKPYLAPDTSVNDRRHVLYILRIRNVCLAQTNGFKMHHLFKMFFSEPQKHDNHFYYLVITNKANIVYSFD